jgi:hypothetical protein
MSKILVLGGGIVGLSTAMICHNKYYVFMTAAHVCESIAIMVQSKAAGI